MGATGNWVTREDVGERLPSVGEELEAAVRECGEKVWLRFLEGGEHTYAEVQTAVERLAAGLAARGVGVGDTVALFCSNRFEFVETWFAVQRLGAIVVPINVSHRGLMLQRMLERAGVKAVFAEPEFAVAALEAIAELETVELYVAIEGEPPAAPAGVAVARQAELRLEAAAPAWQGAGTDPASIMFTSGTTGPSKGVVWSHNSTTFFARSARHSLQLVAEDVFYCCLPLFHTAALCCALLTSLQARGSIALRKRFSVSGFWPDAVASGATASAMLGAMTPLLLGQEPTPEERRHRVRVVNVAPATEGYIEGIAERFGFHVISGYGLTDFGVVIWHQPDETTPPGSCGRPSAGYECTVVDAEGFEVGPGEAGELLVRTTRPGISTQGYWRQPEATLAATVDLWFHTGDLMRRDAEGFYYFVDRAKDAMRRRGENVSSFEVEEAFLRHPEVTDCAAYAVPSELSEDEIAVALVLAQGSAATPRELVEFVEPTIPYFALPRFVRLLEALPMTATEKVRKDLLREEGEAAGTWDREAAGYALRR
ncbi:MAG: AMP-binding protein [Actinobacteria bacterium]|nr:AMP-binding protein [Actinomycetota bacterium]